MASIIKKFEAANRDGILQAKVYEVYTNAKAPGHFLLPNRTEPSANISTVNIPLRFRGNKPLPHSLKQRRHSRLGSAILRSQNTLVFILDEIQCFV